jgi:hypothetical protein
MCLQIIGKSLCFAKSPATLVLHTFSFIFVGVTAYVAGDSALNPLIKEEDRMRAFSTGTYQSVK